VFERLKQIKKTRKIMPIAVNRERITPIPIGLFIMLTPLAKIKSDKL